MALNVHLLTEGSEEFTNWPLCQFEEPEHSTVFFGSILDIKRYPMLLRMEDYYGVARYTADDLGRLLEELAEVIPKFEDQPKVHAAWTAFQNVCREAVSKGKDVFCLGD